MQLTKLLKLISKLAHSTVNAVPTWIIVIRTGKVSTMMTNCACAPAIICYNTIFNRTTDKQKSNFYKTRLDERTDELQCVMQPHTMGGQHSNYHNC